MEQPSCPASDGPLTATTRALQYRAAWAPASSPRTTAAPVFANCSWVSLALLGKAICLDRFSASAP
eukprot:6471940-Lingulodinium_polyedra.AAC.1